jgi:outer membrane protein assembly factor BamB
MGTQRDSRLRRWWILVIILLLLAAGLVWWLAAKPQPLRAVYSEQAWDPIGTIGTGKEMPSKLTLIDGERLLSNELLGAPRVYDLHGKVLWEFQAAGETSMSCAAGADGTIYVGTNKNNVYAIGPDYKLKWKFYAKGSKDWMCCPQPGPDGRVYVTASDGVLYALSAEGQQLWRMEVPGMSGRRAPLVSATGIVVAPCRDGSAIGYDLEGHELWHTSGVGFGSLVPANPEILAGISYDGDAFGWSLQGTPLWQWTAPGSINIMEDIVAGDHLLLQIMDPGELVALDSTGHVQWEYDCEYLLTQYCYLPDGRTLVIAAPSLSTNPVFEYLYDFWYKLKNGGVGQLVVLDQQGQETERYALPFMFATSPPVPLPDGTVLVVGNNGKLYRYEVP